MSKTTTVPSSLPAARKSPLRLNLMQEQCPLSATHQQRGQLCLGGEWHTQLAYQYVGVVLREDERVGECEIHVAGNGSIDVSLPSQAARDVIVATLRNL